MNARDVTAIEEQLRGACGLAAALTARNLADHAASTMADVRAIADRLPHRADIDPATATVAAYEYVAERSARMADEFRGAPSGGIAVERYEATARAARELAATIA